MSYLPLLSCSLLSIIIMGLLGFVLFVLSFKEKSRLYSSSLKQWSLAFVLLTWMRVPTIFVTAFLTTATVSSLTPFIATIAIIACLLFYRGAISIHTKSKFLINTLPILVFVFLISLILILQFLVKVPSITIIRIMLAFHYLIVLLLIVLAIKFLWQKSALLSKIAKSGIIFIILGWFVFLVCHIYLWQEIGNYSRDFWFMALLYSPYFYIGLTISYFLLLIGFVLSSYYKNKPTLKNNIS